MPDRELAAAADAINRGSAPAETPAPSRNEAEPPRRKAARMACGAGGRAAVALGPEVVRSSRTQARLERAEELATEPLLDEGVRWWARTHGGNAARVLAVREARGRPAAGEGALGADCERRRVGVVVRRDRGPADCERTGSLPAAAN